MNSHHNPAGMKRGIPLCLAVLSVAASLLVGCNDSSPTEPKVFANPTPTPAPSSRNSWSLTSQVIATAGPSICLYRPSVGMAFGTRFDLVKSGSSVRFVMEDTDWEPYTATLDGVNFTATNPTVESGHGMCIHYWQTSSLSGSLSEDGNRLTATEIWTIALDSGEKVTTTFRWSANRV
jgi:hypothetical protein